jgi:ABC-2 type transport system permease protein
LLSGRLIREAGIRAALFFVLLEANLVVSILFYPDFAKNMPVWLSIAPIPALRDLLSTLQEFGFPAYLLAQQFFKSANTLGTAAAAIFAMGAVAREVENRTIEFLVSRPIGRGRILATKFALGGAAVVVPVFLSSASVVPLARLVDETIAVGPLLLAAFHSSLFLLVLYAVAFLLSTVSSEQGRVVFVVLGCATLSFAVYMINGATHYSIYRLSDVPTYLAIFQEGRLPVRLDALLLALLGALYALAHWRFVRRDF